MMECNVDGTTIHYEEYGTGTPVLCLHGYPLDHRIMTGCLEPVFEAIDGFRRIYPDLPGMGASPVPAGIENADDMLDALIGFVNGAIGKERFLLIGESYGAYMSFGLMLRLRDQIEGMFLICPAVEADSSKRDVPEKELLEYDDGEMEMVKRDEGYDGSFLDYAVVATQETWLRYKSEIIPGVNAADAEFTERFQGDGYSFSFADKILAFEFNKPVCFILGRQDHVVGYKDSLRLLENFPRATFVVADCAGHILQIERPGLFNAALTDWLDRVSF